MRRPIVPAALRMLALPAIAVLVGGQSTVSFTSSTRVAAAINGNIVLFRVDGSGSRTLTRKGIDGSPAMSPDGRSVAFLRWPGGLHPGPVPPYRHVVMLATPGGAGYFVTRFSPRSILTSTGRAVLVWEPGQHAPELAWYEAGMVVVRRASGNVRWVLTAGPVSPWDRTSHIAWSPDGRQIATATALGQPASGPPTTLRVAIRNLGHTSEHVITIHFRTGVLGSGVDPARGSYPVGDDLTFTRDGHHLLVGTIAKGEGYQLTGVFQAPDTGGTARMILGNGNGVRGHPPFASPFVGATQFQLSPNRKYIATDPNNHFWISGDVKHPHTIAAPSGRSCVLSQWTWLPDSSGLAYVTACTIPGSSPIRYRLTLATVARSGAGRHILYAIDSKNQDAIDLAPAYRCTACGG